MLIILVISIPVIWLVVFCITFNIHDATNAILNKLDIILIIFSIGTLFEIGNRFYIGIKKNKLVSIFKDKADRW